MLLLLSEYLSQFYSGFHVFQYLTLRAILGVITALSIALLVGPTMIHHLSFKQIGQVVRDDGPESHFSKAGTPTMGGVLILVSITISTLLWSDLSNKYIWVALAVMLSFGGIGFIDDYIKLARQDPKGLISRYKYLWQSVAGALAAIYL